MITLCFHHNDADGRCAAAIVVNKLGPKDMEFWEVDYKDVIDFNKVPKDSRVIIVDFSFKPEDMAKLYERTKDVTWIDHHKTAERYLSQYPENPELKTKLEFRDKLKSGCELTWEYFYPDKEMPRAVFLVGDYDCWRLSEEREAKQFYEGLKLFPTEPNGYMWFDLLFRFPMTVVEEVMTAGSYAVSYRDKYCSDMLKSFGYETEIGGHRAVALGIYRFGSGAFGKLFKEYPVSIAYVHDGEKFTVSLYSETVDVGEIAKSLGGGGHKGAAGFVCQTLPFSKKGAINGQFQN